MLLIIIRFTTEIVKIIRSLKAEISLISKIQTRHASKETNSQKYSARQIYAPLEPCIATWLRPRGVRIIHSHFIINPILQHPRLKSQVSTPTNPAFSVSDSPTRSLHSFFLASRDRGERERDWEREGVGETERRFALTAHPHRNLDSDSPAAGFSYIFFLSILPGLYISFALMNQKISSFFPPLLLPFFFFKALVRFSGYFTFYLDLNVRLFGLCPCTNVKVYLFTWKFGYLRAWSSEWCIFC